MEYLQYFQVDLMCICLVCAVGLPSTHSFLPILGLAPVASSLKYHSRTCFLGPCAGFLHVVSLAVLRKQSTNPSTVHLKCMI